jgi:thioredoxin-like negative regulator of GroEL
MGIWLQNRAQFLQQKVAREMELRREIYLLGAESLGKMQRYLVSFADPRTTGSTQNEIVAGVVESLNKVGMIASIEMWQALDKIQEFYTATAAYLVTKKLDFVKTANQLRSDEEVQANLAQNLAQITAALNTANQNQDKNEQIALIDRFNDLDSYFKEQEIQLRQRREGILIAILGFVDDAIGAVITFQELSAPLNVMVRAELGFPLDQLAYSAMLKDSAIRQRKLAQKLKDDWHKMFKEEATNTPFDFSL